jgi:hypothetical protein
MSQQLHIRLAGKNARGHRRHPRNLRSRPILLQEGGESLAETMALTLVIDASDWRVLLQQVELFMTLQLFVGRSASQFFLGCIV